MNKYIGENRLTYLWGKIKAFVSNAISGKVDKVSSSTDNAIVRFDGTSGSIQNSGVTINDSNHLTAAKLITSGGTSSQFVKGDGSLDSNAYAGSQTSGGAANKAVSIPFGQVDSTSTSTAFTATVDGITELRDGVCVYLKNGVVTSAASCTLNVNGLGAKPMYNTMAATTAISTQWDVNYTMLFIYNSTRVSGGCWDMYYGYYYNTDVLGYDIREYNSGSKKVKTACQRYQIMLTCMDGMLLPVYSGEYSNGTSKTLTTEKFNPLGQIYYYYSTTNLSAGGSPAAGTLVSQFTYTTVDIRYSFNTGSTLTVGDDIYLVCVPQDDGSAVLHSSPIAFSLPSTENGLIYKRLGKAYSTYTIALEQHKPCYHYKNGSINLWTGTGTQTDVSKVESSNVIDIGGYDLMKINEVKGKSLVWNQHSKVDYTDSYTTAWSGRTYYNGTTHRDNVDTTHKYFVRVRLSAESVEEGTLQMTPYQYGNDASFVITIDTSTKFAEAKRIVQPDDTTAYYYIKGTSFRGTNVRKQLEHIDLTQMFGAGNEPTTVEEVEAILGNDYYEYNTGEVVGNNVEKLDVTGFNIWDEEWELGNINANGTNSAASDRIRSKNYIPVLPNTTYFFKLPISANLRVVEFDSSKTVIGVIHDSAVSSKTLTLSVNAAYIRIVYGNSITPVTTYNHDICINKSNASKNGTYEPYKHSEFPLNLTELTGKVNGEGTSVTIFPDGLHGVGTAFDSLIVDEDGYARRAVKRMGSRAYASGEESDTSVITDNTNTYYPLATPIEYVLDTPVQCVAKVYPNGTVKQVPVMPDSTPMVMDVTYLHDNGGMIGGLMNRLDSLEPRIDDLAKGIKTISVQYGDATSIVLETEKINGKEGTVSIPAATSQAAGAMSAAQAALLEDLSDLADDIETILASI